MGLPEILQLLATTTIAQVIERDDFSKRIAAGQPLSMLEVIYPLLQGYDSVAVRADVELGGTDQKFNLLMGRDIQRAYGEQEQAIMTMPILVGTDGERKMSKSLGNEIGVSEPPEEIYGKTMSVPDEAMRVLLLACCSASSRRGISLPATPSASSRGSSSRGSTREGAAERAERAFDRVFLGEGGAGGRCPSCASRAILLRRREQGAHAGGDREGVRRLALGGAAGCSSEGAVSLDGERLDAGDLDRPVDTLDGRVLQVGKRRFVRLRA